VGILLRRNRAKIRGILTSKADEGRDYAQQSAELRERAEDLIERSKEIMDRQKEGVTARWKRQGSYRREAKA